jgi:predicted HTH transcriptional regulator
MKPPRPTKKLGEKEDLEYKSQFDGSEKAWLKLIKTAVAMANKKGGIIRYEKILTDISSLDSSNIDNKINSYIFPKLRGIISKKKKSGVDIIIPNSELKPHIFIRRGIYKNEDGNEVVEFYEGQIWIRHSSKNELFDKSDFDALVQEQINKFIERIKIIADDPKYNYNYKNSSGQIILRKYNDECLDYLRKFLIKNPNFNPWRDKL